MITKIVSGGQTGADRGGLEAAMYARLPHGGWCPKGRKSEDGMAPTRYLLEETESEDYAVRTERNVIDSDATLIFTAGDLTEGSLLTAECAEKHGRPWLHVDFEAWPPPNSGMLASYRNPALTRHITDWLRALGFGPDDANRDCVLNVAGQRASDAPGLESLVKMQIVLVLIETRSASCYPINDEG